MKKLLAWTNLFIFLGGLIFISDLAVSEVAAATMDKTSINIYARRRTGTYEESEKRGYDLWGWTPQIDFRVNGPIALGGQFVVEFTKPDGTAWLKFNCESGPIEAHQWWDVKSCGQDLEEDLLARETGLYGLKISLHNEQLFSGKVKVGKFFAGKNQTSEKGHFGYYVDYDWRLPFGQIYAKEPEDGYEEEYAPLTASLWFRGDVGGEVAAYLYYNGKEISNSKDTTKGTWLSETAIFTFDDSKFNWKKLKFIFTNTFVYNRETEDNHPNAFRMDKNPGEYEIKILRKGAFVRSLKFTVGPDGKIVDQGIAEKNSLGNKRIIVPVQVTGDEDGAKPDLQAWRTDAFFGNTLAGFNL